MIAVTSAMRKNARWSGMGVNGLRMGSLGNSMGLRSAQMNLKDSNTREVCSFLLINIYMLLIYNYRRIL
jgi:hypothetical protein